ncbi:ATPase [Fibrobacterales bacterium]|nr:ATPase [Fibrobacterales bacterium]
MVERDLNIAKKIKKGKTLILEGPRRVGKTTLIINMLNSMQNKRILTFDGGDLECKEIFSDNSISKMKRFIGNCDILFIDEAQEIKNIGKSLKLINDHLPQIAVIATGSSSFELNNQIGEPLVGRSRSYFLYPFSVNELLKDYASPALKWREIRNNLLIYGMYPDSVIANDNHERESFLRDMVKNLLLKDILAYQEIKSSQFLLKILVMLAYQIGKEVSIEELGNNLSVSKNTVSRYLDLLEKAYIIFRLGGFSRNLRNEITKKPRFYFYDVGIRNAIINNFNMAELRGDLGEIWENFAIVERMKFCSNNSLDFNRYFWRTYEQNEIDLIEERNGKLHAFEMKYNPEKSKKTKLPAEWIKGYGTTEFLSVDCENLLDVVMKKNK